VHEQGEVEFSPAGQPLRMLGTVQDVTSLRRIETALLQSEETLSGILRISPEAIIITDAKMRISLFSDGAEEIFGLPP
jgi:PAS domain-containing protein